MTILGTLLRNRRPDEGHYGWNQPNLAGPDTLELTSRDFTDGGPLASRHAGRRVGGDNVSPHLAWSEPPAGTARMLLLVEDIDAPIVANPAVHCLALVDPAALETPGELPAGGLGKKDPAVGVQLLRSVIGRGYVGPEALKGHGPHRYVFQLYALGDRVLDGADDALLKARPRALLASVHAPVLARGRITGVQER